MKIFIYPKDGTTNPSTCIDITPYITVNQNQQKRCDDAFAITTFKMIIPATLFTKAKYNIPPFTMFEIASANIAPMQRGNERYFGYSKCTKYLREQPDGEMYYIHDVTLVEPLALLETIQIGTKTFTNHNDKYYLDVLTKLIHNITGYNIHFDIPTSGNNAWNSLDRHSYSYDKGTTAFEIANDIFTIHNCKMKIDFWDTITTSQNAYSIYFIIKPINLDSINEVQFNDNTLTYVSYEQNFDNYCKCLESQVDNVVDRNTITKYSNLTCRSDNNICNADNCFIELPAKIEKAVRLQVFTEVIEHVNIYVNQEMYEEVERWNRGSLTDLTFDDIKNGIASIVDENNNNEPKYGSDWLVELMEEIWESNPDFDESDYVFNGTIVGYNYVFNGLRREDGNSTSRVEKWFDITSNMLNEDIYMALPTNQQPKYCYYKSGDNKIQGIYKYYKDNWISNIQGVSAQPMLKECLDKEQTATSNIPIDSSEYCRVYYSTTNERTNPMDVKWNVEAHPITNQYVKDVKDETNIVNENAYFNTSRSYGNSANYIDYDIMRKNIHISNSFLGTPELTIQTLDYCPLDTNTKFEYDNQVWYVSSIVMEILREHIMYTINASTNYNKQADSIGVRTQYQATKIALDNIKERHIYFKNDSSIELRQSYSYFLRCDFYRSAADESPLKVLLRANIYSVGDGGVTVVAKTIDNFSAGVKLAESNGGNYIQKDVPYADNNGEAYSLTCILTYYDNDDDVPISVSRKLPEFDTTEYALSGWMVSPIEKYVIYKDEHESLAFTVYLPNATYEDE